MELPKPLRIYFIGFAILLILSLFTGYLGIRQYSFFNIESFVNCPYGGEIGPNGELMNAGHICPPDGGPRDWALIPIFSAVILLLYTIIYWFIHFFIFLFRKLFKLKSN